METRVAARLQGEPCQPDPAYVSEVVRTVKDRVALRMGMMDVPPIGESIVVDAAVSVVRRRYYEGVLSESEGDGGSMSVSFVEDELAKYADEIAAVRDMYRDGEMRKTAVRFL